MDESKQVNGNPAVLNADNGVAASHDQPILPLVRKRIRNLYSRIAGRFSIGRRGPTIKVVRYKDTSTFIIRGQDDNLYVFPLDGFTTSVVYTEGDYLVIGFPGLTNNDKKDYYRILMGDRARYAQNYIQSKLSSSRLRRVMLTVFVVLAALFVYGKYFIGENGTFKMMPMEESAGNPLQKYGLPSAPFED